ncbi:MAG: ketoacyl-ACP synthase III [Chlamydiales bacterium]
MCSAKARITGTGTCLPSKILTNSDLEELVETSDEWITSRTGIQERRIAAEDQFTSDMGFEAAKAALVQAKLAAEDVDLIIFATLTPDYLFPSTACLIQKELGAVNAAAFDMQAACSGYLFGLSMAKAYIEAGIYKNIILVASEKLSSIVDYEDRNTCVLFGDGASAAIISSTGSGLSLPHICLGSDGEQEDLLKLPAGGCRQIASEESIANRQHYLRMEGRETFKHAVRRMEQAANECLEHEGLTDKDLSWLVAHQANIRIIDAMAKRFSIPAERVYKTVHKYGNTSASSVGIALHELLQSGDVKNGDKLMLVAFGAGLTWGAALLEKDSNG